MTRRPTLVLGALLAVAAAWPSGILVAAPPLPSPPTIKPVPPPTLVPTVARPPNLLDARLKPTVPFATSFAPVGIGRVDLDRDLRTSMKTRRDFAWQIVRRIFAPVATAGGALPTWETWYEEEDIARLYRQLRSQPPAARTPSTIRATVQSLMRGGAKNLQTTLTAARFAKPLRQFTLPQFRAVTSRPGTGFIHYSPEYVEHFLVSSATIAACDAAHPSAPTATNRFARCMDAEMPSSAVMIKSMWTRVASGAHHFATDAASMTAGFTPPAGWVGGDLAHPETYFWHGTWSDAGIQTLPPTRAFTTTDENGTAYALVAIHIATKDIQHWTWTSMWWAQRDENLDFGADRPPAIASDWPALGSYKMCTVSDFHEGDSNPASAYDSQPGMQTLASAIRAVAAKMSPDSLGRRPQWCANPNLEPDMLLGDCISCHVGSPAAPRPYGFWSDYNGASDFSFSFATNQAAIRAVDASAKGTP